MIQKTQTNYLANTKEAYAFLILTVIATALPFFWHLQWAVGPIVNAILILTLFYSGIRAALALCLIPSIAALLGGLLPAVLAPVLPFIMLSNMILVLSVDFAVNRFKNKEHSFIYGVISGAVLKSIFLLITSGYVVALISSQTIATKAAQMMSLPQLATALAGGMIAWGVLKSLKHDI